MSKDEFVVNSQVISDGWDLHVGSNGLILLNTSGKGLIDDMHIVFEEDFTFESLQISDWSGNSLDYNIVEIPDNYNLFHAYPNPFNPLTTIKYALPQESKITISVYDIRGREIDVLFSGVKDIGYHETTWDASQYSSGAYFIRMNSGSFTKTQKVMLLK